MPAGFAKCAIFWEAAWRCGGSNESAAAFDLLRASAGLRNYAKSPAREPGFSNLVGGKSSSGRFVLDHGIFTFSRSLPTARALGERGFDLLDRLGFGDSLHGRNLTR